MPEEDQGYFYMNVQLLPASSMQRTDAAAQKIEAILSRTPGVQSYNTILGYSLLSQASTTYNAFYFVTLAPWHARDRDGFAFSPPSIPGVGTAGGVTFMLEDRAGMSVEFLAEQINVSAASGVSSGQAMAVLEEVFAETMPKEMGFDYSGMSFQEQAAAQGVSPV